MEQSTTWGGFTGYAEEDLDDQTTMDARAGSGVKAGVGVLDPHLAGASMLEDLSCELVEYDARLNPPYRDRRPLHPHSLNYALRVANDITWGASRPERLSLPFPEPVHALTRLALRLSSREDGIRCDGIRDPINEIACTQAEIRIARMLNRLERGDTSPKRPPAAIIHDQDGVAFAIQKNDGIPTAYAWRNSTFRGKWIPKGAIVELAYKKKNLIWDPRSGVNTYGFYHDDPRNERMGRGVIALSEDEMNCTVHLARFTTAMVPLKARIAGRNRDIDNLWYFPDHLEPWIMAGNYIDPLRVCMQAMSACRRLGVPANFAAYA